MYDLEQKSISLRFKELRNFLQFSQSAFSDSINISRSVIANIEIAKSAISSEVMENVILKHNVNPTWLLTGIGNMFLIENLEIKKIEESEPNVRFLNIAAMAGPAVAAGMTELSQWIYVPGLERRGDYYGIEVEGNSMMPTLNRGDFVVCELLTDLQEQFEHGKVYVVVLRDRILVKRLFIENEFMQMRSDNPLFAPEKVYFDEVIKIFTVVIRLTRFNN